MNPTPNDITLIVVVGILLFLLLLAMVKQGKAGG